MSPLVYVIILNYNGIRWLDDCLKTVYETKYDNFKVLFIDNKSDDGSVEFVTGNFPATEIIINHDNLGFCEGNNVGIRRALDAGADYVVLLNTDVRMTEFWLDRIIDVGEANPKVGILGGVQLVYDGTDFNSWTTEIAKEHSNELNDAENAREWIPVKWVEGSCFAVKRKVIEQIGLLDPIYFMYYEEMDYCRRAAAHGYQIALVPRCRYHHYRGGSSQVNQKASRTRNLRNDRNRLIYSATDLRRSLPLNVARYFGMLGYMSVEHIKQRNYHRVWDILRSQPAVLRRAGAIVGKWRADRDRLTSHGRR